MAVRPASSKMRPSASTISKSPSMKSCPWLRTVMRVEAMLRSSACGDMLGSTASKWPPPGPRVKPGPAAEPHSIPRRNDARDHLHHEGPPPCPSTEQGGPQGHLALLFLWRQDRRPWPERGRQELLAPHHGGAG